MTIPIKLKLKDHKGVVAEYNSSITPLKENGGVEIVTVNGVAKFTFTTEYYYKSDGDNGWGHQNNSETLSGRIRVEFLQFAKIKKFTGRLYAIIIHNSYDADGSFNEQFSFTQDHGSAFSGRDAFLSYAYWGTDWLVHEKQESIIDRLECLIEAEFMEWTHLPVRRDTLPFRLFRSTTNNLILRDGDG